MKRTTLLLSLVAAGLFVALIPARPVPTIPTVPSSVIEVPVSATSVAYCGWVRSDSAIDMSVQLASSRDTQATVTVLQNGGVVSSEPRVVAPFGSVRVASVLPVGVEGSIVEFAAGPAAATAVGDGVLGLVAASCPSTVPDVWVLGGGSTAEGLTLDLRLFNPFPEDAKLTIRALSENGSEPDQSLEAVSVPAQSGRTIALTDILGFREWLSVEIEQVDGRVIPTFVEQASAGGAAVLSGVAAASEWYFPFGGVPELANTLVLVNPSATPIGYQVGRSTSSGAGDELDRGSVDPRQVATIELAAGEGYIVQADGPMAAFLVSRGEGGRASVAGSTVSAKDWLLPGVGALPETTVVILNPTLDDITATVVSRLGQDKVVVAAGGVTSVSAQVSEGGMQVSATGPVVVGWYAVSENGVAYAIGLPYVNE
ncbi:MAG: hypothetical protein JJE47_14190 [Acidimicrobiia bacterium]|nr:hypothetical protein [Acidimicrobiia bacterium]